MVSLVHVLVSRFRSVVRFAAVVVFAALILAPAAGEFCVPHLAATVAESGMKPLPALGAAPSTWLDFFNVLRGGYLEKHFGFRGQLISGYNYVNTYLLKSSHSANPVVMGRDSWLFLSQDGPDRNLLEDFRSNAPLPDGKMRRMLDELVARRDWCAARGIAYLVVVAPNKNTVYPEKLPKAFSRPAKESHLDQMLRYVAAHPGLDVVDLRPALRMAKDENQIFYVTDSHWNAYGAFAAYREIMKHLERYFPDMRPFEREDYTAVEYSGLPGDLAFLLGLQKLLPEPRVVFLNAAGGARARGATYPSSPNAAYFQPPVASEIVGPAGEGLPRAVFFHDSFFWELLPFFAEHFRYAVYAWMNPQTETEPRYFDKALIEREKPDVVVEEFTERYFVPSGKPLRNAGLPAAGEEAGKGK